ncbi:MAG: O-methyltransferase [Bacteroidetes bacterium]|nr:O-methyltransferase [Bacteroidota bacterium]
MIDSDFSGLLGYAERHTSPESVWLKEIREETEREVRSPHMLSGHLQGRLLALLSNLIQPEFILEIGTYTGYSALCLAEGVRQKVVTIEQDATLEERIRKNLSRSPLLNKVDLKIGSARNVIPELNQTFGLVFIDADKKAYADYYDMIFPKVLSGGLILVDNVLWKGKVMDEVQDARTASIVAFNKKILNDSRVEPLLLPLRDGLLIIRKKPENQ